MGRRGRLLSRRAVSRAQKERATWVGRRKKRIMVCGETNGSGCFARISNTKRRGLSNLF